MPNRNYERGYRFEREIVKRCKFAGALFVARGAGSHGSDIIAVFPHGTSVIEAKTTTEYPPPLYTEELADIAKRAERLYSDARVSIDFWIKIMGKGEIHLRFLPLARAWETTFGDDKTMWWVDDPVMLRWKKKVCYSE